jgi:hypothetical protein
MTPSEAYMLGWKHGLSGLERDETLISDDQFAPYNEGHQAGEYNRNKALLTAEWYDGLKAVNEKAFAMWNLGSNKDLPIPPSGSGCRFKYCWMPVDTTHDNHSCGAHGGKDCPLPKGKKVAPKKRAK